MLWPALLITGIILVSNLNVLWAGFAWDDRALVLGNPLIRTWKNVLILFRQPFLGMYYRPVVMASFIADYALWGLRPWGYHLTNLLLHVANALVLFFLLIRLTRNRRMSIIAVLFFSLHPVHKGVVAIADRTGMLSAFFFLACLLLYVSSRQSESRRRAFVCYLSAIGFCALAFFAKEETLALPLVIAGTDWLMLDERSKSSLTSIIKRTSPFFVLAVFYALVRTLILKPDPGMLSVFLIEPGRRLITIPAVLLDYLLLLLFPLQLDYEPRVALGWLGQPKILLALSLLLISVFFAVKASKRNAAAFGFFWFLVVFLPMSNIIPIYPEAAHSHLFTPIHFLYLPSIGIFLSAASGIESLSRKIKGRSDSLRLSRFLTAALVSLLFLLSLLAVRRNFIWSDELRLYRYISQMHPENPRMRLNLGNVYLERGQVDEALEQLRQAVILAPDVAMLRNSLAIAYKEKGWLDPAISEFRRALQLDPKSASAYANLASLHRLRNEPSEAIVAGQKAVELAPENPMAHVNLGLAYMNFNDFADAEACFLKARELDSTCAEAYFELGVLFAREGRYDLAKENWEQALKLKPSLAEARENLRKLKQIE